MKKNVSDVTRVVPCSVILLSVGTKGAQDAMTATAMFVSEDPPLFVVSVAKHLVSHELIDKAGEFVLNVASLDQVKLAAQLGSTHGEKVDKFAVFTIKTEKGTKVNSPVITGSYASIECKVITSFSAGNYTIYLSEVLDYRVDDTKVPIAWLKDRYFPLTKTVK